MSIWKVACGIKMGMLRRVVWYKLTDVSEVLAASIIRAVTVVPMT
jgi:hypothetical protein